MRINEESIVGNIEKNPICQVELQVYRAYFDGKEKKRSDILRQYIITGMNGASYHGFPTLSFGPWYQPVHHGYPFHSIWHPSHFPPHQQHYSAPVWQGRY